MYGNVLRSIDYGSIEILCIYQLLDNIHLRFHQCEVQTKRFGESLAAYLFNLWRLFRPQFYNSIVSCKLPDKLVIAPTTFVVMWL